MTLKAYRIAIAATAFISALSGMFDVVAAAEPPAVPVIFPKNNSIVGDRVNLVLDPTEIPFFQVIINKREYPMVDTSTGRHAYQGLELASGVNTVVVNSYEQVGEDKKKTFRLIGGWTVKVFSIANLLADPLPPAGFARQPFHSRENEAGCAGCHNLEASPPTSSTPKPEEVICYACHKNVPEGKHIHGPAAVWKCLSCHEPTVFPVKYQFTSVDPWKVSKTTQTVVPLLYTFPTADIFKPVSAAFISKDKAKKTFQEIIDHIKENPGDRIRVEVHSDDAPLKKPKGKPLPFKNNQALTGARAKSIASLLKEMKAPGKKITAVGMGDKLPKVPHKTKEFMDLNNRVEVVVYPSDVLVKNSQKLPVLKDREKVAIYISYSQGPQIKKLRVIEKLPKGIQYVKGSSLFSGNVKEPKKEGEKIIWALGDMKEDFSETLYYVVKKDSPASSIPRSVNVAYVNGEDMHSREFDPKNPAKRGLTLMEACLKCHREVVEGKHIHGPVDAGQCNVCHDPHSSPNAAWLRNPSWDLCTSCHTEKATGRHVVAGFAGDTTHPTRLKRDPARPGKRLSCTSCHNPHIGETTDFYSYNAKSRMELCNICHARK